MRKNDGVSPEPATRARSPCKTKDSHAKAGLKPAAHETGCRAGAGVSKPVEENGAGKPARPPVTLEKEKIRPQGPASPSAAEKPPGKDSHTNKTSLSSTGDPGSTSTDYRTPVKPRQAPPILVESNRGMPSVKIYEVPPAVMEAPGDGNIAKEDCRAPRREVGVLQEENYLEQMGKDISSPYPSDDDDELAGEAVSGLSP